tara:strand:- start:135 stop:599 length:465 start_codon:yes stop_codon:yes gene_type:complete
MSDIFDDIMGFFSSVTGIEEIDPDYEKEKEAEYQAAMEAEMKELQAQLDSSSGKERVAAEKRLKELQSQHSESMKSSEKAFLQEKMVGDKQHAEDLKAMQAKAGELPPPEVVYDKDKMARLSKSARVTPTIPSIPQQARGVGKSERDAAPRRPY